MPSFTTVRRVEFHDTDMAGIMHFTSYFRFMEVAEHALLRSLGMSVISESEGEPLSWPRISATCDYRAPARFNDELEIEAAVDQIGTKSVTYRFTFRCQDRELAVGKMTAVCCLFRQGVPPLPIEIPVSIRQILEG